jgi:hypothetical protein
MILGEFLCDHQYLSAFTGRERWPISSGRSQKTFRSRFELETEKCPGLKPKGISVHSWRSKVF